VDPDVNADSCRRSEKEAAVRKEILHYSSNPSNWSSGVTFADNRHDAGSLSGQYTVPVNVVNVKSKECFVFSADSKAAKNFTEPTSNGSDNGNSGTAVDNGRNQLIGKNNLKALVCAPQPLAATIASSTACQNLQSDARRPCETETTEDQMSSMECDIPVKLATPSILAGLNETSNFSGATGRERRDVSSGDNKPFMVDEATQVNLMSGVPQGEAYANFPVCMVAMKDVGTSICDELRNTAGHFAVMPELKEPPKIVDEPDECICSLPSEQIEADVQQIGVIEEKEEEECQCESERTISRGRAATSYATIKDPPVKGVREQVSRFSQGSVPCPPQPAERTAPLQANVSRASGGMPEVKWRRHKMKPFGYLTIKSGEEEPVIRVKIPTAEPTSADRYVNLVKERSPLLMAAGVALLILLCLKISCK